MEWFQFALNLKSGRLLSIWDTFSGIELMDFTIPVSRKGSKIYILKDSENYLYVGATIQKMLPKLKQGLAANGRNGYHGYKWKAKEVLSFCVFCFDELTGNQLESIEAEIVHKIRMETGKWPLNQNEIHFSNDFDKAEEVARTIFEETKYI